MSRILLVEDNALNSENITRRLIRHNHKVLHAEDGYDGVRLAVSELPDLILMDMRMPVMDGFEAISKIRSNPLTTNIPIIGMCAFTDDDEIKEVLEAGCVDYAQKPLSMRDLIDKINKILPHT